MMAQFTGITGKILAWVATALLALLSFLGVGVWNDQRNLAHALTENTIAIRVLAAEFRVYVDATDHRIRAMEQLKTKP